jgi:hypothetical protein
LAGTCKIGLPATGAEDEGRVGAGGVGGVRGIIFGMGVASKVLRGRCCDCCHPYTSFSASIADWNNLLAVGPTQFKLFLYFLSSQILKFKTEAFLVPKNIQTFHEVRFEHDKQISPFAQLQIPTASHVMNFRTDSNLNLP